MQQILATGATGLVGSRFVELFAEEYPIANMDLTTGTDITDQASVSRFIAANLPAQAGPAPVLLHFAAFTDTNRAFAETGDQTGLCYRVNVEGTRHIAAMCQAKGLHLIHISTDFIFDGTKNSPYTETDRPNPLEWYGETKALAEQVVAESGASHTIVRLSYPYRAHYSAKPDIIQKIKIGLETGKLYPQFTDTTITPTFIDDIARGLARLIETKSRGIFHFTGSSSLSPFDLARKVAVHYGFDLNLVKEGSLTAYLQTAARPFARHVAMSNAKAKSELGLTFASIDEGLHSLKIQT